MKINYNILKHAEVLEVCELKERYMKLKKVNSTLIGRINLFIQPNGLGCRFTNFGYRMKKNGFFNTQRIPQSGGEVIRVRYRSHNSFVHRRSPNSHRYCHIALCEVCSDRRNR